MPMNGNCWLAICSLPFAKRGRRCHHDVWWISLIVGTVHGISIAWGWADAAGRAIGRSHGIKCRDVHFDYDVGEAQLALMGARFGASNGRAPRRR